MFSLIIPFHQDTKRLADTIQIVAAYRECFFVKEVFLCHNGPWLDAQVESTWRARLPEGFSILHTEEVGIGAGYKIGIMAATQPWLVLSASDLPFGFSDIEAFLQIPEASRSRAYVGSKLHPGSDLSGYSGARLLFSRLLHCVRLLLGLVEFPRDTQGTLLVRNSWAKEALPGLPHDFRFSLLCVAALIRRKHGVQDLPVKYRPPLESTSSSVSVFRDGLLLLLATLMIRVRR